MFSKDIIEWKSFRWELLNGIRVSIFYCPFGRQNFNWWPSILGIFSRSQVYSHSATKRQQIIQPPPPLLGLMMMAAKVMIAQLFDTTIHPNILYSWGFTVAMVEVVVVATRQWKITRPDHVSPCDGYKLDLAGMEGSAGMMAMATKGKFVQVDMLRDISFVHRETFEKFM